MKKFDFNGMQMICASAEAESHQYEVAVGKDGRRWLHNGTGDNIYHEGEPGSQGFGGRTLTFELKDGTKLELKGPWHSNSDALFADTGVDLRAMHKTFTVVARGREYPKGHGWDAGPTMIDVVWRDEEPTYGTFNRGEEKAQELADQLGEKLFYYTRTSGGAHGHFKEPGGANGNTRKVR